MPDAIKIFVGNKIDLADREVSKKEGEHAAAKYSSKYFEVSAKVGKRLDELFNGVIDAITDHLESRGRLPAVEEDAKIPLKQGSDNAGKSKF